MLSWIIFLATFTVSLFLLQTLFYGSFTVFAGLGLLSWFTADMITKMILNNMPRKLIDGKDKAVFITGKDSNIT